VIPISRVGISSHYALVIIGETIPIRLFLGGFELTPTFRDVNKKFSTRYYLNLVLIDEENRRYFKQQVSMPNSNCFLTLIRIRIGNHCIQNTRGESYCCLRDIQNLR
jgi:hypothetical protein